MKAYLTRIRKIDRSGPKLRSIISLNPAAISEARRLDALRNSGTVLGPLHGVPVLLKDNIESKDNMPTTAGALALKDNITNRDSPLTAGLRAQGAIILGKTNLSQWANFRSENSMSGWSALGGQVKNPHILDRNPSGSSSGSGAAMAASLAAAAVGTETNGSIISSVERQWHRRLQTNGWAGEPAAHHSHLKFAGYGRPHDQNRKGCRHDAQRDGDR